MIPRVLAITIAAHLLGATPGHSQAAPSECPAPNAPDAFRLALLITDPNGLPFSGIGQVTIHGASLAPRRDESRPIPIEYWYCSDELPRGRYTVEVRAVTFDCVAIELADSETGLVVRVIRLRPDPWRPASAGRHRASGAVDPNVAWLAQLSTRRCGVAAG